MLMLRAVGSARCRVGIVSRPKDWSERFRRRIVEIFRLLAGSVLTSIGKATLYASLARPLVPYAHSAVSITQFSKTEKIKFAMPAPEPPRNLKEGRPSYFQEQNGTDFIFPCRDKAK